ncbi:hypothetical protein GGF31_008291 [Allomyces arbusculus]|nr:hypothetical protein GGF31_008291 [Allomyces arbusculus]
MTAYRERTLSAHQQVDDRTITRSDYPVAPGTRNLVHQNASDAAVNDDGFGPGAAALGACTDGDASLAFSFDRLTRLLEQQDRDIRNLRERLNAKDRELHDVLETVAAKDHAIDQSQERIGALDQELVAARGRIAALEEQLTGVDAGSEVATVVDASVTRIRARAAGFHDGNFFELEIGNDRDLYTAQRGIHVTILRRGADGKLTKRHDLFDTGWSQDDSKRLRFLLEMLDILLHDTASAVVGVVIAAVDEATRNLRNEERTTIAKRFGSVSIWDLKWRGGFVMIAKLGDPKATVESIADAHQGPTEWVEMEF